MYVCRKTLYRTEKLNIGYIRIALLFEVFCNDNCLSKVFFKYDLFGFCGYLDKIAAAKKKHFDFFVFFSDI